MKYRCKKKGVFVVFTLLLFNSFLYAMKNDFENTERKMLTNNKLVSLKVFAKQETLKEQKKNVVYFQLRFSVPKNNIDENFVFNESFAPVSNNTILPDSNSNLIELKKSILVELSAIELYSKDRKFLFIRDFNCKEKSCIRKSFLYYLYFFLKSYSKISCCDYMLIPRDYIRKCSFLIRDGEFENNVSREFFFKRIIPLSLNVDNRFIMYGKAPVTILTGTSTAGKTTLVDLFKKSNPNLVDYSIDPFCDKSFAKTIKKFHENEYARILKILEPKSMVQFILGDNVEEISNLIQDDLLLLKSIYAKGIPRNERSYFKSKLYKLPFKIFKESKNGSPVIMDFKFLNLFEMFWNFKASFTLVWVFCPLKVLSERLKMRNIIAEQEKKLSNKRSGVPLLEYAELYRKKIFPHEVTLEVLKQKVAIECFQDHFPGSTTKTIKDFLKKIGFKSLNTEEIEITFRHNPFLFAADKYLFIDTSLDRTNELLIGMPDCSKKYKHSCGKRM